MRITVDTGKDSKEEIREVIELLQRVSGMQATLEADAEKPVSKASSEAANEMVTLAGAKDLFGNDLKDDEEMPKIKVEKDDEQPEIRIVPY